MKSLAERLSDVLPCTVEAFSDGKIRCSPDGLCFYCVLRPAVLALLDAVRRETIDATWEHAISIVGDGCDGDLDFAIFKMRKLREESK